MQSKPTEPPRRDLEAAWQSIRRRDWRRAVPLCKGLNQRFPGYAPGWLASSCMLAGMGMPREALQAAEQARALAPGDARVAVQHARCLQAVGRVAEARNVALELAGRGHDDPGICADLAELLVALEQPEDAGRLYRRAVQLHPGDARLHLNLAIVQQFLGELREAANSCDQAIGLDAHCHDAYLLRASLAKQTEANNHVEQLRAVLGAGIADAVGKAKVCYALAKELEDLARYRESFRNLAEGASAYRATLDYDPAGDLRFIDAIIANYDGERMARGEEGYGNDEPIFILGLPRTGSTLLERILGSHSEVSSAGELTHFTRRLVEATAAANPGARPSRERMVELTTELDFAALGRAYIDSTRPLTGQSRHFIDKFPQNSLNIGPIHLALPRARIILLQRHPLDTCYAIFKQLFTDIYQFSYDLEELGHYYVAHDRLMRHWQSALPGVIHTVRYEDLVERTEETARAALEFCGLDWQPQCLEFQRSRLASRTASASQVRQKVYSSSVGRWRCYEQELAGLRQILEAAGCLEGWAAAS